MSNDELILTGDALEELADLFTDESRLHGSAQGVARPTSEQELLAVLRACTEKEAPVTVSAGLTGITGSGVPQGGVALNVGRMDRVLGLREEDGRFTIRCQPGVVLADLRDAIEKREFEGSDTWPEPDRAALAALREAPEQFLPCDPTEWSACIGGMTACNASGARTHRYGPMRDHVVGLRAALVDGRTFELRRDYVACTEDRAFELALENGQRISGRLPGYTMPKVKHAAGYYAADGMDLLDLFVGSEGTLAVFTEIGLRLRPAPARALGIIAFVPSEKAAVGLVHALRGEEQGAPPFPPAAIEFFGHRALDLLRVHREETEGAAEIPELSEDWHTGVFVEFHGDEEEVDEAALAFAELLEAAGCDEEATWMATEPREHERLRLFRHAVPEAVNLRIGRIQRDCPDITKLGTDMAVPNEHLDGMLALYRERLEAEGLEYVIFGHIADNHLHVNILPHTQDEYARGKEIYKGFAQEAVARGGTVSAEHGIGKLKTFLLPLLYGEEGVEEMRRVKRLFDPGWRLNPGTLFPQA